MQQLGKMCLAAVLMLSLVAGAMAVEVSQAEWESMKSQIADLQQRNSNTSVVSSVDTAMDGHYAPEQSVVTRQGKLTIGLLTQVWYYSIQRDKRALFDDPAVNAIPDSNTFSDNSGFRIRRTELAFKMEICENISAMLMIDPAREAGGFPNFPSNQGNDKKANNTNQAFIDANGPAGVNSTALANATQNGAFIGGAPRLLQDAYITWHDCVPHHDFRIGQFRPWVGEEGIRSSAELDFAERSMVGIQAESRDIGASVHGSWWGSDKDGRFQYWGGVFNGSGTYFEPGNSQNRQNDNSSVDYNGRMLVRPLWSDCLGHLELGGSFMGGQKGEGGNRTPDQTPLNALNKSGHWASRYNAWASYKCPDVLSGLWLRGEWTKIYDRESSDTVLDALGAGTGANANAQEQGATFSKQGIYGAVGYRFSESKICNLPCWLKGFELAARYDQFQNVTVASLTNPRHTDVFYTKAITGGINYYITGNTKIQANYNAVRNPNGGNNPARPFHSTDNNSFLVNFQVAF